MFPHSQWQWTTYLLNKYVICLMRDKMPILTRQVIPTSNCRRYVTKSRRKTLLSIFYNSMVRYTTYLSFWCHLGMVLWQRGQNLGHIQIQVFWRGQQSEGTWWSPTDNQTWGSQCCHCGWVVVLKYNLVTSMLIYWASQVCVCVCV